MALDQIRLGTPPSGQDGDDARTAFTRCNANFKLMDDWGVTGGITRSVTNLNDATQPGWWSALAGGAANLPPGITYPLIFVGLHSAGFITQEAMDVTTGKTAWRTYNANGAGNWGGWRAGIAAADLGSAAYLTATQSVLDKTVGRALRVNDFGLGGALPVFAGDCNTIDYNIRLFTSPGVTNAASNTYGYLEHIQSNDSNYACQEWRALSSNAAYRRFKSEGTWKGWYPLYTSDLIIGSVGFNNSKPVGGVIESGVNANGVYTKFADGSLVCSGDILLPAQALNTDTFVTATFAAAFSAGPKVVYSPAAEVGQGGQSAVGLVFYNGTYYSTTATTWTLRSYSYRSSTPNPVQFRYIAHGRWT